MITIGIDLGTTNSLCAFDDGTGPQIIETLAGEPMLPSAVAVNKQTGDVVLGHRALRLVSQQPEFVFTNIKRHIGLEFADGEEFEDPYVVRGPDGRRWFRGRTEGYETPLFSASQLSALLLGHLKASAEKRLRRAVEGVVLTHPAGFDNNRMKATKDAAIEAGFKRVTLLTEPEAAILAYGVEQEKHARVLVVDTGGGTVDIVMAEVGRGDIEIGTKTGNEFLGGVDWDRRIRNFAIEKYRETYGDDLMGRKAAMAKIMPGAELAKRDLTESGSAVIEASNVAVDRQKNILRDVRYTITREEFDKLTADLVQDVMDLVQDVMTASGQRPETVHRVLLIGGMTHVPAIRDALAGFFGEDKLRQEINPAQAVARGAAIKAAMIDRRRPVRYASQRTAATFGIELVNGVSMPVFPAGTAFGSKYTAFVTNEEAGADVLKIRVKEGNSTDARDNVTIARYDHELAGGLGAGEATIVLDFEVTESGFLTIEGNDLDQKQKFTIRGGDKDE